MQLLSFPVLTIFLLGLAQVASAPPEQIAIDAPYVASPPHIVDAMLRLAKVGSGDVVYDLGCGDGRIVVSAAQKYGARGVGIDNNPVRIDEARENARAAGVVKDVRFELNDLFDADIHEATVVAIYLLPDVNLRLRNRLVRELRPGTRVVSHEFAMGDWKPDEEMAVNGSHVYLWTIPER